MRIVGLGGLRGDAACALLIDGRIVAAAEQKKLVRHAAAGALPVEAIACCLEQAGLTAAEVDAVAIARPLAHGPETAQHLEIRQRFPQARVAVVDHHTAHAASAFYLSPFKEATVLTLDGGGDFRCGARWKGSEAGLALDRELYFPDSLGDLFARTVELLGMKPHGDENKLQWLSTRGDARYQSVFEEIVSVDAGGWPRFHRGWYASEGGFSDKLYRALGLADGAAVPEEMRAHVAAGVQRALEAAVIAMAGQGENLCLAGGVFGNTLLVSALERSGRWKNVFAQPAAGNAGTAPGAALHAWKAGGGGACSPLASLSLGPSYEPEQIKHDAENCKLRFRYLATAGEVIETALAQLNGHKIVAWMQGRMEFGPRALGNRSILASPLDAYSSENLNSFIKRREPYRKFAAAVPEEAAGEYFEATPNARFLATVCRVRPAHRERFAGALVGEDLVRVHVVSREENPLFHKLLLAAGDSTGLPVLYNTSFNLFGDPLVCSPRDAVRSFYSSGIDAMLVGHFFFEK
ncbi:MAG: carbamoyltransferase [Acidobacteria bacterium]|nr:carbamoyltransferase [Acidobacteriota bacterium]